MSVGINKMPVVVPTKVLYNYFERIAQADSPEPCWNWTGSLNKKGYGYFSLNGTKFKAHRFSYFLQNGKDPIGSVVMHKCDNPSCCNPYHLELGTDKVNCEDRDTKGNGNDGERNPQSKLTNSIVLDIRSMDNKGVPTRFIADKYNMNYHTIRDVVMKRSWKHI